MLITCNECGGSVSDKAFACPHCGCPLKLEQKSRSRPSKRMKLPNGFGRITEIKGKNLRKPFRAMVSDGKDENGRPIGKLLKPNAYFETYNEAYAALIEYNKNPYSLEKDMTMQEVYDKWIDEHSKNISPSRLRTITSAWDYCKSIHKMNLREVRARHIKLAIVNASKLKNGVETKASSVVKTKLKGVFIQVFDYAIEYELTDRNYAKDVKLPKNITEEENKQIHHAFTDEEMLLLWNNQDINVVKMLLIQCYMGWRPGELCKLEIGKIDMKNWNIIGGSKTTAGKNRIVPVHTKIRSLVQEEYNLALSLGSNYLFNYKSSASKKYTNFSYYDYVNAFNRLKEKIDLKDHKLHDPRKHFITMAKKYNVNEYAIKLIVGHSISDITESIYTERNIDWLHKEIAKIP